MYSLVLLETKIKPFIAQKLAFCMHFHLYIDAQLPKIVQIYNLTIVTRPD